MKPGSIGWVDLTVTDAAEARDFYREVIGFASEPVAMDGYDDFCMIPQGGDGAVAGICHARGTNAELPPVWMVYWIVEDLGRSLAACRSRGGAIVAGPKAMGESRYAVIRDPGGAVSALFQPAEGGE